MCQAKTSLGNGSFKVHSTKLEKTNLQQVRVCFQHFPIFPATICTVQSGTERGRLVVVSFTSVFRKMKFRNEFVLRLKNANKHKTNAINKSSISHVIQPILCEPGPHTPLSPLLESLHPEWWVPAQFRRSGLYLPGSSLFLKKKKD